jgi:hypothetical protein
MICDDCREAGVLFRLEPSEAHPEPKREAERKHNICKLAQAAMGNRSRCPCQHRTDPNTINLERIPNRADIKADAARRSQPD